MLCGKEFPYKFEEPESCPTCDEKITLASIISAIFSAGLLVEGPSRNYRCKNGHYFTIYGLLYNLSEDCPMGKYVEDLFRAFSSLEFYRGGYQIADNFDQFQENVRNLVIKALSLDAILPEGLQNLTKNNDKIMKGQGQ
jgi:hypothetical protein